MQTKRSQSIIFNLCNFIKYYYYFQWKREDLEDYMFFTILLSIQHKMRIKFTNSASRPESRHLESHTQWSTCLLNIKKIFSVLKSWYATWPKLIQPEFYPMLLFLIKGSKGLGQTAVYMRCRKSIGTRDRFGHKYFTL